MDNTIHWIHTFQLSFIFIRFNVFFFFFSFTNQFNFSDFFPGIDCFLFGIYINSKLILVNSTDNCELFFFSSSIFIFFNNTRGKCVLKTINSNFFSIISLSLYNSFFFRTPLNEERNTHCSTLFLHSHNV